MISEHYKILRKGKGLTQKDIVEKSGLNRKTVIRFEGGGSVSSENLNKLVDAIGCRLILIEKGI
jgi:transcriptional regulator with XRE-family HTH domain